jgi:predicted Zn-dependent protease
VNTDSNKNLFIAFAIIGPLCLAIACIAIISGQTDPFRAIQEARRPRTLLDDLSDMRVCYAEKKWEEALQAARTVLRRQPGHEEALRMVASSCLKLKRPGEAAAALKVLVDDVPEDIPTRISYASALTLIGEKDEALNQWTAISESRFSTVEQRRLALKSLRSLSPETLLEGKSEESGVQ